MRILLVNSCGLEGVVALADEAGVRQEEKLPGRGNSEGLMPAMARLFAEVGWAAAELTAVGVAVGPGSFTGVRVGLAAAKGICDATGAGMVGMSRLELLGGEVAVLDGGRGEYFCRAAGVERLLRRQELPELEGAVTCELKVSEVLGVKLVEEPGAEGMLREVLRRIGAGEWSDVATMDANYLRRTDAEILVYPEGEARR